MPKKNFDFIPNFDGAELDAKDYRRILAAKDTVGVGSFRMGNLNVVQRGGKIGVRGIATHRATCLIEDTRVDDFIKELQQAVGNKCHIVVSEWQSLENGEGV